MVTISQRISLEGSDDIRRKLEELGKAGEKAFKQIQDAAKQPISDPAAIDRNKQAFEQLAQAVARLGPQFKGLVEDVQAFGQAGSQAGQKTAAEMDRANQAIGNTATGFKDATAEAGKLAIQSGIVAGAVTALMAELLGVAGKIRQAISPAEALKGTVETGKALGEQAAKLNLAVPEWLKLKQAIAEAGVSEADFIAGTSKLTKIIADAKGKMVELFPGQWMSTSKGAVAVMRDLAEMLSRIGDKTERARLGSKLFGENWEDVSKVLLSSKAAADATEDLFDKLAKVDRAMRPDQAEKAAKLAKAWEVLGKAIRAAKDQIGTVLLDSALLRAGWLIKLIDASRELFKTWQQLAEAKKAAFLKQVGMEEAEEKLRKFFEGLGDTPAELLFKTLLEMGQLLAALWEDVLVPAGKALFAVFRDIGKSLGGIPVSNVIAFFLTAAIAATALAVAFRGILFVLTPLASLFSLAFSPLGAVLLAAGAAALLFWDQLKAGAQTVAALIPAELAAIGEAIKKLFSGDFVGAWNQFSAAAISAFEKIKAALAKTEVGKVLIAEFNKIRDEVPGTLELIVKGFLAIPRAAQMAADAINKVFGTKLTGTDVMAIGFLGEYTGALRGLANAATIAAAAMTTLGAAFGIVAAAIGGVPALVLLLGLLGGALIGLNWDTIVNGVKSLNAELDRLLPGLGQLTSWLNQEIKVAIFEMLTRDAELLSAAIDGVTAALKRLISIAKGAPGALRGIAAGGGEPGSVTPPPGNARGGYIRGPGSATSDSILARLSNGEFVLSARATRHWGVDFLRALNSLQTPRFSMGGLVPAMPSLPRFADGGLVGGMRNLGTVDLRTDHGSVSLMASPSAVEQLSRLAATKRITSTGRKPGFIG